MIKQYRITSDDFKVDTTPDCVLSPDDSIHEILGTKLPSTPTITTNNKAQIQRERNIKPGTDEWFKLWFSKPELTGELPYEN